MHKYYGLTAPALLLMLAAPAATPGQCGPTWLSQPVLRVDNADTEQGVFLFGRTAIGESTTRPVRVTNVGDADALIHSPLPGFLPTFGAGAPFFHTGGSCAENLWVRPGESCTVDLRFAPTEVRHTDQRQLVGYITEAGSAFVNLRVIGTGAYPGAALSISDAPGYDFGPAPVGTTTTKGFLVWSEGTEAAVLGTMDESTLGLTPPFGLVSTSCQSGAVLSPVREISPADLASASEFSGSSPITAFCAVIVAFSPTVVGSASGALRVHYASQGGEALSAERTLTGSGSGAAP